MNFVGLTIRILCAQEISASDTLAVHCQMSQTCLSRDRIIVIYENVDAYPTPQLGELITAFRKWLTFDSKQKEQWQRELSAIKPFDDENNIKGRSGWFRTPIVHMGESRFIFVPNLARNLECVVSTNLDDSAFPGLATKEWKTIEQHWFVEI